ncbi:MAG TPA: hypothetical protein ENI29_05885 [bacterium]|nr:hypothetical protein [bacterium]
MKKIKTLSKIILGLLLFIPFGKVSLAQESYVGIQNGDEYIWRLSMYAENWGSYFDDLVEGTLRNLLSLSPSSSLTQVYLDWIYYKFETPPQSQWPFTITAVGPEETGTIFSPFDNTTITSTPINATTGWRLSAYPSVNSYYNSTWYIVNDTSSFLRQTLNLTLAFSPYGIMSFQFAPTNINWTLFITEFLGVMNSRGGLYKNISATVRSNGYSLHVPALGFEQNSVAIDISVKYNSIGVLSDYEFSYGGKKLVKYWSYISPKPILSMAELLSIIFGSAFFVFIVLIVLIWKKILKDPIYIGV